MPETELTSAETPKVSLRAIAFFDCQNLHKAARRAWGYKHLNFEPGQLAKHVAELEGLTLEKVCIYTGYHSRAEHPIQNAFVTSKISKWLRAGHKVHHKLLAYQAPQRMKCTACGGHSWKCTQCQRPMDRKVGHEKGVDVHMALDIVDLARTDAYDVAILFTQDQDFAPAVEMALALRTGQQKTFRAISAFPLDGHPDGNRRPVDGCDTFVIARNHYDQCMDRSTYGVNVVVDEIASDYVPLPAGL